LVIEHFENLLDLWDEPNHPGIEGDTLSKSLGMIYRALGARMSNLRNGEDDLDEDWDEAPEDVSASEVLDRFSEVACLWEDGEKRFWIPRYAFSVPVPFFGHRRAQLKLSESVADAGYEVLGRRSAVQASDVIDFLEELEFEYGDAPLPESMQSLVVSVLRLLDGDPSVGERANEIPLLTAAGRLFRPFLLFEDDDAYHRPYIHPDAVHVVHSQVSTNLSFQLGVPSLVQAIEERMAVRPELASDAELIQKCNRVQRTLHSSEFEAGIRRILRDRPEHGRIPDISWLRRIEIIPTLSFEIELWLAHEGRNA